MKGLKVLKSESKFINKYKKEMTEVILTMFPDLDKKDVEKVILDLVKFKTPVTVIINLIGGVYLLYILIKENKE